VNRALSVAILFAAAILIAFGALSVHYTSAEDADHHRVWAESHHVPPPAIWITVLGWTAITLGASLVVRTAFSRRARAR